MPNNRIGWGQGSVNNTIGWGSAAAINNRNWGWLHARSYGHDETNLVGNFAFVINGIFRADGYTIFGRQCSSNLASQIKEVPPYTYYYDLITTKFTDDSYTIFGNTCSYQLVKKIF